MVEPGLHAIVYAGVKQAAIDGYPLLSGSIRAGAPPPKERGRRPSHLPRILIYWHSSKVCHCRGGLDRPTEAII